MMLPLLLLSLICADPVELRGRVVSIADGDTITILTGEEQVKVRLSGIDAQEKAQPFGTKAKEHLAKLVHEKDVRIVSAGKDRYGRTLGTVWVGELNVNAEQIKNGMAWQYRAYSKDPELAKMEAAAKEAKLGLWADPNPIAPWEWRKGKR